MATCCKWPCTAIATIAAAILGVVLIVIGGILIPVFDDKFSKESDKKIEDHAVIKDSNSEAFKAWENWSHFKPTYRSFYFFNVSNANEVVETGRNLTVKEIGPYVYRVTFKRKNVAFVKNDTGLTFELYKTYEFQKNMSSGRAESDIVTVVNLPILNLAFRVMYENETVNEELGNKTQHLHESLFSRVNVSDLLWGYENSKLSELLEFLNSTFGLRPLKDKTYGLMYQHDQPKRKTYEGEFEISTGADGVATLWKVKEWNGNRSLNFWKGTCNDINGTDGYSWQEKLNQSEDQFIFDSEWCRSIRMTARGQESVANLTTNRYNFSNDAFSYEGANSGFCQPTPKENITCLKDGVLNNTKCKDNIPLLLSQPHFLGASGSYRRAVRGINPNPLIHSTTFNLEPRTGEVVKADRKLQLNAYVMKLISFPDTAQFNDTDLVVPIAWMNETYSMTDEERDALNSLFDSLVRLRQTYDGVQYGLIVLGGVLFICAVVALLFILYRRRRGGDEDERRPLLG